MNKVPDTAISQAAEQLWLAERNRIPCPPVRELIGTNDLRLAYQVQDMVSKKRLEHGAIPVGKKIGLTSEAVQKQLGVDQPDFGTLFGHMEIKNGSFVKADDLMQARVEAEFALVLKEDILELMDSSKELIGTIDHVRIGLEVVGSRIKDWDIKITDTISDNASASHFVLGDQKYNPQSIDLLNTRVYVYKNDVLTSEGVGKACMGSPLNAFRWLANTMLHLGNPLKKREVILTGALGPLTSIAQGDKIRAIFEGYGEVSFEVE